MTQTAKPKVLISDALSERAVEVFAERGVETIYAPDLGKDKAALAEAVREVDGLAIRSATKVTPAVLEAAGRLRVIGRAGIGVDNVDVPACTRRGVVVMNTPFGNSTTTAEHAIALMMSLSRQIPEADRSTQAGKWEKSRFLGVEITGKTLGLIGCGNVGGIVATRALGLKMRVLAFDPFLSEERAQALGVTRVDLDKLLAQADFISLHAPLTDRTRNILSAEALAKTRPGVRIVNCARGGLVDEAALRAMLDDGRVAGAAFDVFTEEPARENVLFGAPNFIATPHLGASTAEAQETVALQIAEQMADYLVRGAVSNALNMPAVTAEEAPRLAPWAALAERLGAFAGQLTENPIQEVTLEFAGEVSTLNLAAMTQAALYGLLRPQLPDVNMVSAPGVARDRGVVLREVRTHEAGAYESYLNLVIRTDRQTRNVAGTVFSDGQPRIIQIKGIRLESAFSPYMLYTTNEDKPGFIGALGMALGEAGVNIANFNLGRRDRSGEAIALVEVDEAIGESVLESLRALPHVRQAKALSFA